MGTGEKDSRKITGEETMMVLSRSRLERANAEIEHQHRDSGVPELLPKSRAALIAFAISTYEKELAADLERVADEIGPQILAAVDYNAGSMVGMSLDKADVLEALRDALFPVTKPAESGDFVSADRETR